MKTFYSERLQKNVSQIQKRKARKLFNEGKKIYLQASNMCFDNFWSFPLEVVKGKYFDNDFDRICSEFTYYNCDSERGKYIRFYVEC